MLGATTIARAIVSVLADGSVQRGAVQSLPIPECGVSLEHHSRSCQRGSRRVALPLPSAVPYKRIMSVYSAKVYATMLIGDTKAREWGSRQSRSHLTNRLKALRHHVRESVCVLKEWWRKRRRQIRGRWWRRSHFRAPNTFRHWSMHNLDFVLNNTAPRQATAMHPNWSSRSKADIHVRKKSSRYGSTLRKPKYSFAVEENTQMKGKGMFEGKREIPTMRRSAPALPSPSAQWRKRNMVPGVNQTWKGLWQHTEMGIWGSTSAAVNNSSRLLHEVLSTSHLSYDAWLLLVDKLLADYFVSYNEQMLDYSPSIPLTPRKWLAARRVRDGIASPRPEFTVRWCGDEPQNPALPDKATYRYFVYFEPLYGHFKIDYWPIYSHSPSELDPHPSGVVPVFSHVGIVPNIVIFFGGFPRGLPSPPTFHYGAAPYSSHFNLIGFQDFDIMSPPNLPTCPYLVLETAKLDDLITQSPGNPARRPGVCGANVSDGEGERDLPGKSHPALNNEVLLRADVGETRKREIPEKTRQPATYSGTIPTCENPGVTRLGIEPSPPLWEASALTAQTPRGSVTRAILSWAAVCQWLERSQVGPQWVSG
ncbi:hypothetical protein PR048_005429 [Dryococelus australis]|uniref:Uncharacterized protein n=1 Tax=Dryococelus australis TaxID=614101 RepID=A0ABQ9I884_9NEOP|nr:hypothetical protein PR048_005429 [Dryococelus australis]